MNINSSIINNRWGDFMKWTLAQLRKTSFPLNIDYKIDMKEELLKREDIYDASDVVIKGVAYEMENDEYVFALDISLDLKMACSVTLDSVDYKLKFHTDEVYSSVDDEDINLIVNGIVDLDETIKSAVALNIPMKVVKEGAEDLYISEEEYENNKASEEKINPAFAELKDFFKNDEEV